MSAPPYGRRADAERNRECILDRAVGLLAEDPAIGMGEIAAAAGIGRATLYRHFPKREDLLEALDARAADEAEQAILASRLDEGSACEALERLVAAVLRIGDRYAFLLTEDRAGRRDAEREARIGAPLYELMTRGQAAGEFSRALSPRWTLIVFGAVILAAMREVEAGELDREQAPAIVTATLLRGYRGE